MQIIQFVNFNIQLQKKDVILNCFIISALFDLSMNKYFNISLDKQIS